MNAKHLLDAMNDIDYSMVEEAENMMNRQKSRIPRRRNTVWIVAAVLVLLCITVAAAGLRWMTPELHVRADDQILYWNNEYITLSASHILYLRDDYITLPESSRQTVINSPSRTPDNLRFSYTFSSVEEWQSFYEIPLVISSWLSPYGTVGSSISVDEKDNEIRLGMMSSRVDVEYLEERNGVTEQVWFGGLEVVALVDDDAGEIKLGGFERSIKDGDHAEIIKEFTTAAGIPCVISKIKPAADDSPVSPVSLLLYYGYEAVMYEFEVFALSEEEEAIRIEQLMTIADTLQIIPVPTDQSSSAE